MRVNAYDDMVIPRQSPGPARLPTFRRTREGCQSRALAPRSSNAWCSTVVLRASPLAIYSSLIALQSGSFLKSANDNSCGRASWRQLCHRRPVAAGNEVSTPPGSICDMNN